MENHTNCDPCSRAWAAGLFDGEGSATSHRPKNRQRVQPKLFLYQAGLADPPEVLVRFRDVVECGTLLGPYRERLWCWSAGSARDIARVATMLWPWLGPVKRAQFCNMSADVPSLFFMPTLTELWSSASRS